MGLWPSSRPGPKYPRRSIATFSDITAFTYGGLGGDPVTRQSVESVMAAGKVIVIEVVERFLAGGLAPFLDPTVISDIKTYLTRHPAP